MIEIDGSQGEGGGQVLRSALTLAMATGQPFRVDGIRAGRAKPGLMRQHLASVRAAAAICGARVSGDALGSQRLVFEPGPVRPGDYRFTVGSAGSTTLVLQTVLLPLALAGAPSQLTIEGGTHNPLAPPFEFIERAWLPLLHRIGYRAEVTLLRPGFFPAGGGAIEAAIEPAAVLGPLVLEMRGAPVSFEAVVLNAHIAFGIGQREARVLAEHLGWDGIEVRPVPEAAGPGNVVLATLAHEQVCEVVSACGERGRSAEAVATAVVQEVQRYLKSEAPVGPHLADQLLLPMALGGGGRFVASACTPHTRTNMAVIGQFLGADRIAAVSQGAGRWGVAVRGPASLAAE